MQSDDDKKDLFDVSLTDNIKISFEQSSCPYEYYACKIRSELLKQIEEDIWKVDGIKDEPCHSLVDVGADLYTRVKDEEPLKTVADARSDGEGGVNDPDEINDAKVPAPSFLLDHSYCLPPLTAEWCQSSEHIKQKDIDTSSEDYLTQAIVDVNGVLIEDIKDAQVPVQCFLRDHSYCLPSLTGNLFFTEVAIINDLNSDDKFAECHQSSDHIKQENTDTSLEDNSTQAIEDVKGVLIEDIKEEPCQPNEDDYEENDTSLEDRVLTIEDIKEEPCQPNENVIDYEDNDTSLEDRVPKIEDNKGGCLLQHLQEGFNNQDEDNAVDQPHRNVCEQNIRTKINRERKNISTANYELSTAIEECNDNELREQNNAGDKPYACDTCAYRSKCKSRLRTHLRRRTCERSFICNICAYETTQKCYLKRHLRKHSSKISYSCAVCSYKCSQKLELARHQRTHRNVKSLSCDICSYKCSRKCRLQDHLRTHAADKPYSCNVCSYKCIWKRDLKRHLVTHTGERPISCDICSYKCARKCHLKAHLKSHASKTHLICNICSLQCSNEWILKLHMRKHKEGCLTKEDEVKVATEPPHEDCEPNNNTEDNRKGINKFEANYKLSKQKN